MPRHRFRSPRCESFQRYRDEPAASAAAMVILGEMQDSWPSGEHEEQRASPLPRVEDIPYVERGYDPERVREAFDAFYRHLARLDATLRTIEAVQGLPDPTPGL